MSYNPGDILKDRYVIKEVLGQGSMGEVYLAEHVTIHRQFAIKLLHVHIAEKENALARFRREASAAALLDHPHICQVTDFDSTDNGDFYLVMEYLKGETLRDRLTKRGTIKVHSIFHIMDDLLAALECAHEHGIVHRDVKPENISLIERDDRDDYVKLIDFGIAHADKPDDNKGTLTQAGQVYGTPQYLSPEQVMGNPVDLRADLYSCGCLLYEMIEGNTPFDANNYILLLNKHLVADPPHLSKKFGCNAELDEVIQKLLKKQPEERYGSAREVRKALADIAHKFDPTLNLFLSQNGSTSPATVRDLEPLPDLATLELDAYKGTPSSSSLNLSPEEAQILRTGTDRMNTTKPAESIVETPEQPPKKEAVHQNKGILIGLAVGIVVTLLVLGLVLMNRSQDHKDTTATDVANAAQPAQATPAGGEDSNQQVVDSPKQDVKAPENDQPVIDIYDTEVISELNPNGYILSDEQIREFAKTECHIDESDPLYKDELMRSAIDSCANGDFEEAYKYFDKSKNKYKGSMRFFIMSLINSYATKRYRDAIRDALQLVVIAPAAVCTPAVREIIYSLYEDDDTYVRLRTGFLNLFDQPGTAEGLSWLLLMTPCNQHQQRFERLSDSIKVSTRTFEEEFNDSWLGMAVRFWDKYDPKSMCPTKKSVDRIVMQELGSSCSDPNGPNAGTPRCTMCYPLWKQRTADNN